MRPENKFSVKSTIYMDSKSRGRSVDGPWKPTVEEAVQAYAEMLVRKGLEKRLVCSPFLAEKMYNHLYAPSRDGRGVYYQTLPLPTLPTMLARLGLSV
jgi:hypothetical protein